MSDSVVVASFAARSANTLPGMFEFTGTYFMKMDDEMDIMHCQMEVVLGLHDEIASHSDWLSVQMKTEVQTEFAFVEMHCKAASMTVFSK